MGLWSMVRVYSSSCSIFDTPHCRLSADYILGDILPKRFQYGWSKAAIQSASSFNGRRLHHTFRIFHFTVSNLPLLFTFDCQVVPHIFPCLLNPLHRNRLPCRLGLSQPDSNTQLLLAAFMARLHHYGIVCSSVCSWILQFPHPAVLWERYI